MSLETTLDLIKNADAYEKRLKELKDAEANVREATAQLTQAKNIDLALKRAQQAEQTAIQRLKEADDKANRTEQEAKGKADVLIQEATKAKQELLDSLKDKTTELASLTANAMLIQQQLDSTKNEVITLRAEAEALSQENEKLRAQIKEKQKALTALLNS